MKLLELALFVCFASVAMAAVVTLTWDPPVPIGGEAIPEGYVLERGGVEVWRGPGVITTDTMPAPGTYTYGVRAFAGTLLSTPSNLVVVHQTTLTCVEVRSEGMFTLRCGPAEPSTPALPPGPYPVYGGVTAATADSQDVGYEAEGVVDGQAHTLWHTEFRSRTPPLPHWLRLDMGQPMAVDGLRYLPRQDGNLHGAITAYVLEASLDGATWIGVGRGTWVGDSSAKEVRFPATKARFVRLTATASSDGLPYASAAEVGVYGQPLCPDALTCAR